MQLFKFVDLFGIIGFLFLLGDAVWDLYTNRANWRVYTRLLIAVIGLVVDVYIVFLY
jgi:hypothetical protein